MYTLTTTLNLLFTLMQIHYILFFSVRKMMQYWCAHPGTFRHRLFLGENKLDFKQVAQSNVRSQPADLNYLITKIKHVK